MKDATTIMKRHTANPLISPDDYLGVMQIYNPSPVMYKGETILLVSMLFYNNERLGETRVARSKDGLNFKIDDKSFINLNIDTYPYNIINRHIIDNRVTLIDDTYYILTPVGAGVFDGPATIIGKTKDFEKYEPIEVISLPRNRGISLFPEKIDDKYYRIDRPGAGAGSIGSLWLSSSPDLVHWGAFRPLLYPFAEYGKSKIGPTPPIKTDKGWLVIIHAVSESCGGTKYSIGAILLDLEKPWEVIGKTYSPLLSPEMDYELSGWVDNVVFPCGAIADHTKDELHLYYGAADTRICLATGSLSEIINACIENI
jgi:predicted GH43/DUF377 family glycosyl hydrolase